MEEQSNRRRQLVVNRDFQFRYILGSALAAIIVINLTLAAAFLLADSWRNFLPQNLAFAIAVALAELAAVLIVVWLSLKASHRIAGPAHRLSQLLAEVGAGKLTVTARLREGDCLQDVAGAFNAAIPGVRRKVAGVKSAAAAVKRALAERADAADALQRLDAALAALDTDSSPAT